MREVGAIFFPFYAATFSISVRVVQGKGGGGGTVQGPQK